MASNPEFIGTGFRIVRRIGGGSFGQIYMGIGPNLTDTEVAVKFELKGHDSPQLRHEYKVYRELKGCRGICRAYFFGDHLDRFNLVLVMELMGLSLEHLFERCGKIFSLKTVLQIADQLLVRAHTLHEKSIIHRDIKPQNFVVGLGAKCNELHIIDFGLAKFYRDPKTLVHLPFRDGSLAGTPRYASISNHLGIAQARRDDVESIGYMLVYFLKGKLPWQGFKDSDKRAVHGLILKCKQSTTIASLCDGIPKEFADFLHYARSMRFEEEPDLAYTRGLFRNLYEQHGFDPMEGNLWDWEPSLPATTSTTKTSVKDEEDVSQDPALFISSSQLVKERQLSDLLHSADPTTDSNDTSGSAAPEGPEMSDLVHSAEPTTDSNDTSGSGPLATDMMEQEVSNHHHPQRRTRRVYSFIYIYVAS